MYRRSRSIPPIFSLAALALLPVLPACEGGFPSVVASSSDTVYVGVAVGLQNPERYENVFRGVELALDELNEVRQLGTPALALRRPPADAKSHIEVAAAFRDDPSVIGVVGHTESEPTLSAAPVYEDRENGGRRALVAVSPAASGTLVARSSEWVFRVCPVVDQQARAVARWLADSAGVSRAAVVYRSDASGRRIGKGVPARLRGRVRAARRLRAGARSVRGGDS
jgi:branched-chain amino acid transport system substrate-binding protein